MELNWLALCRPGFERELAHEADELGATPALPQKGSGYVSFTLPVRGEPMKPWRELPLSRFIFARQLFHSVAKVTFTEEQDPLDSIAGAVKRALRKHRHVKAIESIVAETPDTPELRPLQKEAEELARELPGLLAPAGIKIAPGRGAPRLHLFVKSAEEAEIGLSSPQLSSPWSMGAPKLELPPDAPSRSARKLEEAITLFIPPDEVYARLKPGMRAVDLGASPGGWSWTLANRGLVVDSVDNGKLAPSALKTGLITHHEADGFTFRPSGRVDWMVCDIVAGGPRVAKLVANWIRKGLCSEAIFNLKLGSPEKLAEVKRAKNLLMKTAGESALKVELQFRHLYHDRDEITGHIRVLSKVQPSRNQIKREAAKKRRATPASPTGGRRGRSRPAKKR